MFRVKKEFGKHYYYYYYYYYDTHMHVHVHVHVAEREWYVKGRRAHERKAGRLPKKQRERNETKEKKKRCRKSAAPGLPEWSPTAVLPRLEPA